MSSATRYSSPYLQLLLNYCRRFYGRQFITRSQANGDVVARLEKFLIEYFDSARPVEEGIPGVASCAKALGYSADYLTDLLKKETGKNARDHIADFLVAQAKNLLLGSHATVSEIAFSLGFEQPAHFSKLFKRRTGQTPGPTANERRLSRLRSPFASRHQDHCAAARRVNDARGPRRPLVRPGWPAP